MTPRSTGPACWCRPTMPPITRAPAGSTAEWCLSHQVWAGSPVPVARCLDCGQLSVDVEPEPSCGKCMGTLEAEDDVLDARFAGTLWPLVAAGWPDDRSGAVDLGPT